MAIIAAVGFIASVWGAFRTIGNYFYRDSGFGYETFQTQYKRKKERERIIGEDIRIPIVYGYNKVFGHTTYREDIDDEEFDILTAFCEGEIDSIDGVEVNEIPIEEIGADTSWNTYTGLKNQTGDDMLKNGIFVIKPVADAYTSEADADYAYGANDKGLPKIEGEDFLYVYWSSSTNKHRYLFLKFDLSILPAISSITKAEIHMYLVKSQVGGAQSDRSQRRCAVNSVTTEVWTEDTITWNNQPAINNTVAEGNASYLPKGGKDSLVVFDITDDVLTDLESALATTFTVCINRDWETQTSGAAFASKESVHPTPVLKIWYTTSDSQKFNNTAYIAMTLDTESITIGNYIPEVTARIKGMNQIWNANTSVYEYSTNPIWILHNLLTNSRYGLGFSTADIDDTSFITAATYCDGTVTNAEGIEEDRYHCDIVLDTARSSIGHIQEILATCAGFLYILDGTLHVKIERDETFDGNTQTFRDRKIGADLCNIIEGSFSYSEEEQETVPNIVSIRYTDADKNFKELSVSISDDYDISLRGKKPFDIPIYGINRRTQAIRLARFILLKRQLNKIKARFRVSINNCWISLGDPCYITHAVAGWTDKKFRVILLSEFSNEEIELYCEEYDELVYIDDSGSIGIDENPDIPYKYTIPPITSLTLTEVYSDFQKPFQAQINIAFTEPTMINPFGSWVYEIWVSPDNDTSYVYEMSTTTSPVVISVTDIGTYYVKIKTRRDTEVSSAMLLADAPEDSIVLVGEDTTPAPPALSAFDWSTGVTPNRAIWTTGNIVYKGIAYNMNSGNTTNAYIYFDTDISTTVLQTSASRPTINSNTWIIAYFNEPDNIITLAEGGRLIHAGLLQANSITANEIEAGTITATEITVATLSALTADMGSLDAGQIVITKNGDKIWLNDANDGAINLGGNIKADSLIRFNADGSGYVADGKISWTTAGVITLTGTGAAGFAGDFINSGTITGGVIQTASSGQRIVMTGADGTLRFHTATTENVMIFSDGIAGSRPGILLEDGTNGAVIEVKKTATDFSRIIDGAVFVASDTNSALFLGEKNNTVDGAVFWARIITGKTGDFIRGDFPTGATQFSVNETGDAYFAGYIDNAKSRRTGIGGYAIKLTNKTGSNTVQGQLVTVYTATAIDDAFKVIATNDDATFGVVLEASVADGSEAWIVVSGIADVLMDAGGSARGDRIISSGNIAGSADVWNVGGAVDIHFQEIGHCLETRGGAGLAKCTLHFN